MIDLHCHSIFSDGVLTPEELAQRASARNIQCLSLTDHDTVSGYSRLLDAAKHTNISLIKGIELSVRWKKYDLHILGYQIDYDAQLLQQLIARQKTSRYERGQGIAVALEHLGVENAHQKACMIAGHEHITRPHFAQLLVNEGRARDMQAAFRQFLARGRPAFVPTPWVSLEEAVACISQSNGQAVIAHPLKYGLTRTRLHELIKAFKEAGGVGMEVVSGEMTSTQIKEMAGTSLRFDLLASSGSDFHNDKTSRVALGAQARLPENCTPIWHNWII